MKPSSLVNHLRRIAHYLDKHDNPSRKSVISELNRISKDLEYPTAPEEPSAEQVEAYAEHMREPYKSRYVNPIIESNYELDDADIAYSYNTTFIDENDNVKKVGDTLREQDEIIQRSSSPDSVHSGKMLIAFPDIQFLVDITSDGESMGYNFKLTDKSDHSYHSMRDYNINDSDIKRMLEFGSDNVQNVTNKELVKRANSYGFLLGIQDFDSTY